ncbi:MAG: crossover junction endodeoxyribonuclease RuvC [Planctomycetes bacterium]|nr:crossover junction endodeoxyribonuclease RuvC [Planctomycetota bacterium]
MEASSERLAARVAGAAGGRILGIDPGLQVSGYAVVEGGRGGPVLCEGGVIRSRRAGTLAERVAEIFTGLQEVIASFRPGVVAIEQLFSAAKNPRTALLMAHARGVICLAAAQAGIPVAHYTPTRIKKMLTGSGRAPKRQVQQAIQNELRLRELPEPPDVADALALALCHYHVQWTAEAQRTQRLRVAQTVG